MKGTSPSVATILAALAMLPLAALGQVAQPQEAGLAERLANARAALVALEERYTELENAQRAQAERLQTLEQAAREREEKLREADQANRDLATAMARLRQAMSTQQGAAKRFSASLAKRSYRTTARHVAVMPGLAIPYVGAGVAAANTALDIREACDTLRELNELNRALQVDVEQEAPVCAQQSASREEIIGQVIANWRTAYAVSAAWINQTEVWLLPEPMLVPPARAAELWTAVFGSGATPAAAPPSALPRAPQAPVQPQAPRAPALPAR
jgi:hypothetical protein